MGAIEAYSIAHLVDGGEIAITTTSLYIISDAGEVRSEYFRGGMAWVGSKGAIAWVRYMNGSSVEMRVVDADHAQNIVSAVSNHMGVNTNAVHLLLHELRRRKQQGWILESQDGPHAIVRKDPWRPKGIAWHLWSVAFQRPERVQLRVTETGVIVEERITT